jgi:hypothetical protein
MLKRAQVLQAARPSPWDLTERVLYALCRRYPDHRNRAATIAKILLIGRSNAAAIERRRTKTQPNEDFYLTRVEPKFRTSRLDRWLDEARAVNPATSNGLEVLIKVHGRTTDLFDRISGLSKRSLASKYLHFHVPRLFYLYDSRARDGMRSLTSIVGRAARTDEAGDIEYSKFALKCHRLQRYCAERFGLRLRPRALDRLLLSLAKDET